MTTKFWLLLASIIIVGTTASAKCPMTRWDVKGRILSANTNFAVEGAQIFVFMDGSESTNSGGYATKFPDYFLTARDGSYSAICYFDSFAGRSILGEDRCSKRPSDLTVIVIREGFLTKRKKFTESDWKRTEREGRQEISLPDIAIAEPLIR